MAKKSWVEKYAGARPAHVSVLAKPYAGVAVGQRLLIASPEVVEGYMRRIPSGMTRSVPEMRRDLALAHGADATCPTSTAIFVRIVAELAAERLRAGRPADEVAPFWRLVDPNSSLARKLSCGPELVEAQRGLERAT